MPLSVFPFRRTPVRALRTVVVAVALLAVVTSFNADAASRRDQAAIDAIGQRMQAAEADYREAVVKIGNADPDGQAQANSALEDMEDAIAACVGQRDCSVMSLLPTYERLLKVNADAAGTELLDDDIGPDHAAPPAPDAMSHEVPQAARAAALLADDRHAFDRMVQYNPAVQEGIRRWLTDMRDEFITSHENYQYLRPRMWPQYERAGLPEALLFGIMAKESHGRVHSTSRAGAAGPMQFMYTTGQRFGLGDDGTGFDTRYDAYAASEASVAYLNERMRELDRSIELALAAYNGGEGRARRIHRENPGKSFWHEDVYQQFPPETRDYVPMVIAAAWLFLHPREYGLSLPDVDPNAAVLRLEQPASIYQLTICLGNRGMRAGYMRALRNLNPRYRADDMLPAGTTLDATRKIAGLYKRHCVESPRAALARTLVASDPAAAIVRGDVVAPPPAGVPMPVVATPAAKREYKVQRGETLTSIASKFQCDTGQLARANDIGGPRYAVRPGQTLQLEGCRE